LRAIPPAFPSFSLTLFASPLAASHVGTPPYEWGTRIRLCPHPQGATPSAAIAAASSTYSGAWRSGGRRGPCNSRGRS
ncbi:hypothetical protein C8F04DRAFT_1104709, partial [Mycena alexandri]